MPDSIATEPTEPRSNLERGAFRMGSSLRYVFTASSNELKNPPELGVQIQAAVRPVFDQPIRRPYSLVRVS
jgi:hypothetical protein